VLDDGIDREHGIEAIVGFHVLFTPGDEFAVASVIFGDAPAADAGEFFVEDALDAVHADGFYAARAVVGAFGGADVPEDMGGEAAVGIGAHLVIDGVGEDALSAQVIEEVLVRFAQALFVQAGIELRHDIVDALPRFEGDLPFENDIFDRDGFAAVIHAGAGGEALGKFGLVHLEKRGDFVGDDQPIIFYEAGVGANGFDEDAGGEEIAARVEDVTAPGLEAVNAAGEVARLLGELFVAEGLQVHEPRGEPAKGGDQQRGQEQQPAMLQAFEHTKVNYQPPVPIGSSSDGVTGGGKNHHLNKSAAFRRG
jgi:hypothetical protein